jgi:hypothetical protein
LLIDDRRSILGQHNKIRLAKSFAGQHDRARILNRRVGDLRVTDNDGIGRGAKVSGSWPG